MMELFERIQFLIQNKKISQASVARHVGVSPQSFDFWLCKKSQKNLWEHLQKIEELFPEVRRKWLWWGEGSIFKKAKILKKLPCDLTLFGGDFAMEEKNEVDNGLS